MGKKRANKAKKKQVARKKRLSSMYGVSVSKGGTALAKNIAGCNSHVTKQNGASTNAKGEGRARKNASTHTRSNVSRPSEVRAVPLVRSRECRSENDEFRRMHASLEERSLALQARKDDQRRSKQERQQPRKKGWGKFAGPTQFPAATLNLASKTTQDLVEDAANLMAKGMNEIGQQANNPLLNSLPTLSGRSSLAAAASLNWQMRVSSKDNQLPQAQSQNNPFAAFENDGDSDDECATKKAETVKQLQFKPASFSFQTNICHASPEEVDDIDPDL